MQTLLVLSAMVSGLLYSSFLGGFTFSSFVCLIAGLFLVTPALFSFELKDLALITRYKKAVALNIGINFIILPTIALGIGYLTQDFGIAAALLLLSILPGGGMIMHWIKQSGANVKLGFILFIINLLFLFPAFFAFNYFQSEAEALFPAKLISISEEIQSPPLSNEAKATQYSCPLTATPDEECEDTSAIPIPPFAPFVILILIPFFVSRFILQFTPSFIKTYEQHKTIISSFTIFGIIFYLFGLSSSQVLFSASPQTFGLAFVATLAFYLIIFGIAKLFLLDNKEEQAVFWHLITRYITLALIIVTFSLDQFGASFILPIMSAYFIQIGLASFISQKK